MLKQHVAVAIRKEIADRSEHGFLALCTGRHVENQQGRCQLQMLLVAPSFDIGLVLQRAFHNGLAIEAFAFQRFGCIPFT